MICISAAVSAFILLPTLSLASSSTINATYDDLKTIPGEARLAPVGKYLGLSYQNFNVASFSILNESASGIIPHSNPNVALAPNSGTGGSTPTITTQSKPFSPISVYYGCAALSGQGLVSVAAACNLTVKGFKAGSSSPSATQTLKFVPLEPVDVMNPLTFATFVPAAFKNIQTLSFSIQPPAGVVFALDNLYYTIQS